MVDISETQFPYSEDCAFLSFQPIAPPVKDSFIVPHYQLYLTATRRPFCLQTPLAASYIIFHVTSCLVNEDIHDLLKPRKVIRDHLPLIHPFTERIYPRMTSLLSRVRRKRTISQTTVLSSHSSFVSPGPLYSSSTTTNFFQYAEPTSSTHIDKKIVPDLISLFSSFEAAEGSSQPTVEADSVSLRPRVRKSSTASKKHFRVFNPDRSRDIIESQGNDFDSSNTWATFGRSTPVVPKELDSPPVNQDFKHDQDAILDGQHLKHASTALMSPVSRANSTATHSRQSQSSPSNSISPGRSDPSYSGSAAQPRKRQRRYLRHPRSQPELGFSWLSVGRNSSASHSADTFGQRTSAESLFQHSACNVPEEFKIPPLPPLDHPELRASIALNAQKQAFNGPRGQLSQTFTFPQTASGLDMSKSATFPRASSGQSVLRSGRRIMHRRRVPRQLSISSIASSFKSHHTKQESASRRLSAEWSAQEAEQIGSIGGSQSWPVEVSREFLRLTLGDIVDATATLSATSATNAGLDGVTGAETSKTRTIARVHEATGSPRGQFGTSVTGHLHRYPSHSSPRPSSASYPPKPFLETGDLIDSDNDHPGAVDPGSQYNLTGKDPASTRLNYTDCAYTTYPQPVSSEDMSINVSGTPQKSAASLSATSSIPGPSSPSTPSVPSTPQRYSSIRITHSRSRSEGLTSVLKTPTPIRFRTDSLTSIGKGKRKAAEDTDGSGSGHTPPDQKKEHKTTFAVSEDPRVHRPSGGSSSLAPSSFHRHKRPRLYSYSPSHSYSRGTSSDVKKDVKNQIDLTGSISSRIDEVSSSRAASFRSQQTNTRAQSVTPSNAPATPSHRSQHVSSHAVSASDGHRRPRPHSSASIPISALVSPQPPSIARSGTFHMRDPRRPPTRPLATAWTLRLATEDEPASPTHAWLFFLGFVIFPLWWIASLLSTPKTRRMGGSDEEKAIPLDDPQLEYDAKRWRFRCRIMSIVSLFTYVPFIVLVAVFASR